MESTHLKLSPDIAEALYKKGIGTVFLLDLSAAFDVIGRRILPESEIFMFSDGN